jgi:type IV pilus assembly protein PilA
MDLYMDKSRRNLAIAITAAMTLVIAIAAITIPAWHDHQRQAHVAEALQVADAAKLVVMEAATVHGGLANIKASELGYARAAASNRYVASIEIADGGRITLTTTNTGAEPDPMLVLVPSNGGTGGIDTPIVWTCVLAAGESSAVPAACRASAAQSAVPASAATSAK